MRLIMKKIDVKDALKNAKASKIRRVKVSFTFEDDLYKEFQDRCIKDKVTMSRLLEEFMRQYIES